MMKTDLFKKLATFRVGVLGLEKFEIFHDDENQDDFIISKELEVLHQVGIKWEEYFEWMEREFDGLTVNLLEELCND